MRPEDEAIVSRVRVCRSTVGLDNRSSSKQAEMDVISVCYVIYAGEVFEQM